MATGRNYQRSTGYRGQSNYASRGTYRRGTDASSQNGQRRNAHASDAYVYDNLARQLEEVPQRRELPQRRRRVKVYPKQKPVAMPSIGGLSFLFLLAAAIISMFFCFQYLKVQSGITQMKNEVVSLQGTNAETKIANEEAYQKIMDSVDLSEVYQIATGELGMVQAVDNQVFKYKNKKSDMIKQYGDIPDASK